MRARKNKGPLRNFRFLKEADEALMELVDKTGRVQVVVLEDLLLQRRQFSPHIEEFLESEAKRSGKSRLQIIEAALLASMPSGSANSKKPETPMVPDDDLAAVVMPVAPSQSQSSKPQSTPQTIAADPQHLVEHHSDLKYSQPKHSQHKKARRTTRHHAKKKPRRASDR